MGGYVQLVQRAIRHSHSYDTGVAHVHERIAFGVSVGR